MNTRRSLGQFPTNTESFTGIATPLKPGEADRLRKRARASVRSRGLAETLAYMESKYDRREVIRRAAFRFAAESEDDLIKITKRACPVRERWKVR